MKKPSLHLFRRMARSEYLLYKQGKVVKSQGFPYVSFAGSYMKLWLSEDINTGSDLSKLPIYKLSAHDFFVDYWYSDEDDISDDIIVEFEIIETPNIRRVVEEYLHKCYQNVAPHLIPNLMDAVEEYHIASYSQQSLLAICIYDLQFNRVII